MFDTVDNSGRREVWMPFPAPNRHWRYICVAGKLGVTSPAIFSEHFETSSLLTEACCALCARYEAMRACHKFGVIKVIHAVLWVRPSRPFPRSDRQRARPGFSADQVLQSAANRLICLMRDSVGFTAKPLCYLKKTKLRGLLHREHARVVRVVE